MLSLVNYIKASHAILNRLTSLNLTVGVQFESCRGNIQGETEEQLLVRWNRFQLNLLPKVKILLLNPRFVRKEVRIC